jgi:hypothetical protein
MSDRTKLKTHSRLVSLFKSHHRIETIHIEVEGKNLTDNISIIESCLSDAGLIEDKAWRNKGSRRNRLFKRAL